MLEIQKTIDLHKQEQERGLQAQAMLPAKVLEADRLARRFQQEQERATEQLHQERLQVSAAQLVADKEKEERAIGFRRELARQAIERELKATTTANAATEDYGISNPKP